MASSNEQSDDNLTILTAGSNASISEDTGGATDASPGGMKGWVSVANNTYPHSFLSFMSQPQQGTTS